MPKFLCPYCFNPPYNIKRIHFACPNPSCDVDIVSRKLFGGVPTCPNPVCKKAATTRKCPRCAAEIAPDILTTPHLPFSIVGVPASGKTVYITTLIQEMKRTRGLPFSLMHLNDQTKDHQLANAQALYDLKSAVESTAGSLPFPQVWKIQNIARRGQGECPPYTFTIFDGAGEDYKERLNKDNDISRYIGLSESIILVLDPLTLRAVRDRDIVNEEDMRNSGATNTFEYESQIFDDATQILDDMTIYIRQTKPKYATGRLPITLAVVVTKFDTIKDHETFPENALVRQPSEVLHFTGASGERLRYGIVNMEEIEETHRNIADWLDDIDESSILRTLEANYDRFKLFGVSSYGSPPPEFGKPPRIESHRVLDPFLWLLKEADFID